MKVEITPTWAEFGLMYSRFAESGETGAVKKMRVSLAQATALAQAFSAIQPALNEQQREIAVTAISDALALYGY